MFIAFDGLDGVGKTTLVQELAQHYGGIALDTPGTELRPVVDNVLTALGNHQTARCLFYAGSALAAGHKARQLAEGGQTVFMDRYWLSTIAYARARGVTVNLSDLEAIVPAPDLTILLTLDETERRRRINNRAYDSYDAETFSDEFRSCVLREMRNTNRRPDLRPVEVDVTGMQSHSVMLHIASIITRVSRSFRSTPPARNL